MEDTALEAYIEGAYEKTRKFIEEHPFVGDDAADEARRHGHAHVPGSRSTALIAA